MKRSNYFLAVALGFTISTFGQATFDWAKSFGGSFSDQANAITTDAQGNVYTTGFFADVVDFDPGPSTYTLGSVGGIFISKLDAAGNFAWAKVVNGADHNEGRAIAVDASGNVYTTGYFKSTSDFDPGPGAFTLANSGNEDIFVLKLDAAGNFVWAKSIGNTGIDIGNGIDVDAMGNVFVTGYYSNTVDFDPGIGSFNLTSAGSYDAFVLSLNTSGNFVWAKNFGGSGFDIAVAIKLDPTGNIHFTGSFETTSDFDPDAGIFNLVSAGVNDIFISKLGPLGNLIWAKGIGSSSYENTSAIVLDGLGNIYTTGNYQLAGIDFDPGPGIFMVNPGVGYDAFVSKLDASGNFVWAKAFNGPGNELGMGIAIDNAGDVYTTGNFTGTLDFDPGVGTHTITALANEDVFISKLDASGNFLFAKSIEGTNSDYATGICIDALGNIISAGHIYGTADLDPYAAVLNVTPVGQNDAFVLKLSQCISPLAPVNTSSAQIICAGNSAMLSVTASGTVNWYTSPSSTTALASGTLFITPILMAGTHTYYAQSQTCTNSTSMTAISVSVSTCTGLNESIKNIGDIYIYPNPTKEKLNIILSSSINEIKIYNSLGSLIDTYTNVNTSKIEIDLITQSAGIYFIQFISPERMITKKIILE